MEVTISNYNLDSKQIIGVLDNENHFLDFIKSLPLNNKTINIDKSKLNSSERKKILQKVSIIDRYIPKEYLIFSIYQYMRHYVMDNFLNLTDYHKKIKESLNIVGLKDINIDKKLFELSCCEKKLLQLATILLSNPKVIIFDSFLEEFDVKYSKKLYNLFTTLVERYKKIIILCSNKSSSIYKYTKKIIIIKNNKKLIEGNTEDIFSNNVAMLINQGIDIPETILFSYKVNTLKHVKLNYHKDTRDLIKDIYKKV